MCGINHLKRCRIRVSVHAKDLLFPALNLPSPDSKNVIKFSFFQSDWDTGVVNIVRQIDADNI